MELKPCPFKHADGDVALTIFDGFRSHIGPYKKGDKLYKGEGKKEEVDEIRWETRDDSPYHIN